MDAHLRAPDVNELFRAILSLEDVDECYRFFEDLATVGEIRSMAQRLQIARRLARNDTCQEISQQMGASTATIGRVKTCLEYGTGGYGLILSRLEDAEKD